MKGIAPAIAALSLAFVGSPAFASKLYAQKAGITFDAYATPVQGFYMQAQTCSFNENWWEWSSTNVTIWVLNTLSGTGQPYAEFGYRAGWDTYGDYFGAPCLYHGYSRWGGFNGAVIYENWWAPNGYPLTIGQDYRYWITHDPNNSNIYYSLTDVNNNIIYQTWDSGGFDLKYANVGLEAQDGNRYFWNGTDNHINFGRIGIWEWPYQGGITMLPYGIFSGNDVESSDPPGLPNPYLAVPPLYGPSDGGPWDALIVYRPS